MDVYSSYVSELNSKLRLELKGVKSNNNLYSGWEINKISDDFNEIYYKSELIRTVEELIENGTNPSDIWIMDKSFDINKKYVNYSEGYLNFDNTNDLKYLYYLGAPTPLYTNKKAMLLSITFDAFRKVYSICNKYNINIPSRTENLNSILREINQNRLTKLTSLLVEVVFNLNNIKDLSLKKRIKTEIEDTLKNDDEKIQKIVSNKIADNTPYLEKYEEYDDFSYLFNSLDRPIVLENKRSVDNNIFEVNIICHDFLVSKKYKRNNPRFLETNLISQNSPLVYIVSLSLTVLPSLILILKKRQELIITKKSTYEEVQIYEEEIRNCDLEIEKLNRIMTDLSNENRELETDFSNFKETKNITAVTDRNNDEAKNIIKKSKDLNIDKGLKWLNSNNLELDFYEKNDIN